MQVTLFASVSPKYNPYVTLLRRAVQSHCEGPVLARQRFGPGWVIKYGRPGHIAHIHWIESHLLPNSWFGPHPVGYRYLIHKLVSNRVSYPVRATVLLVKLALALALARWMGVRVVYTVHNLVPHHNHSAYFAYLRHLANRLMFAWADAIHVHSRHTAEAVAQSCGRTHNVFVVPLGNYMDWYPNMIARDEARQCLGLPSDAFVYLFLGQIAPYKGLEELLEAFATLNNPSAWLVIAGKVVLADYGAQLTSLTRRPQVVYRPGFVPDEDVQVYLNAADVVVLPYRQITTSASALLAFSFGRPIVAPALGALSEIVPACVGVSYIPEEPGALAAALRRARSTSWSSQPILAHARQFDWRIVGVQMANIYRAVLPTTDAAVSSQEGEA